MHGRISSEEVAFWFVWCLRSNSKDDWYLRILYFIVTNNKETVFSWKLFVLNINYRLLSVVPKHCVEVMKFTFDSVRRLDNINIVIDNNCYQASLHLWSKCCKVSRGKISVHNITGMEKLCWPWFELKMYTSSVEELFDPLKYLSSQLQ